MVIAYPTFLMWTKAGTLRRKYKFLRTSSKVLRPERTLCKSGMSQKERETISLLKHL
jgi:hypothetical protein